MVFTAIFIVLKRCVRPVQQCQYFMCSLVMKRCCIRLWLQRIHVTINYELYDIYIFIIWTIRRYEVDKRRWKRKLKRNLKGYHREWEQEKKKVAGGERKASREMDWTGVKLEWSGVWDRQAKGTKKTIWAMCYYKSGSRALRDTRWRSSNKKCWNIPFSPLPRTPQTAVRRESWCVTSIRAVVMAASSTMSSTALWLLMAPSARSSWSLTTGVTPPAAGRQFSCPSVTPALTALEPRLDTGQVGTHIQIPASQAAHSCSQLLKNSNNPLFFYFFILTIPAKR